MKIQISLSIISIKLLAAIIVLNTTACNRKADGNQTVRERIEKPQSASRTLDPQRCGYIASHLVPSVIDDIIQNTDRGKIPQLVDGEEAISGFDFNEFKPVEGSDYYRKFIVKRLESGAIGQVCFETLHSSPIQYTLNRTNGNEEFSLFSVQVKMNDQFPAKKEVLSGGLNEYGWFLFDHLERQSFFIGMRRHRMFKSGRVTILMQLDMNLLPCRTIRFYDGVAAYTSHSEYDDEHALEFEHVWIFPSWRLDHCSSLKFKKMSSFMEFDLIDRPDCKLYLGKIIPGRGKLDFPSWMLCGNHLQHWQEFY